MEELPGRDQVPGWRYTRNGCWEMRTTLGTPPTVRRLGWLAGPRHASRQASDASSASGCDVHEEKSERLEVQEPEGSSRVSGGGWRWLKPSRRVRRGRGGEGGGSSPRASGRCLWQNAGPAHPRLHMLHRYRLHGLSTLALCTAAYGGFSRARDKTHVCLRFKKPSPRIPCYPVRLWHTCS